jgi:hypothetical protein
MATFNTQRLVDQIKVKGCLADGSYSDQEILDLAYDAMLSELVPLIVLRREEYYVRTEDFQIVAGKAAYDIPYRAIGGTLREVKLINDNNSFHIERIDPKKIDRTHTGQPYRFYVQGNNIILHPEPTDATFTLRLSYFLRPSRFVPSAECGQITAINGQIVTATLPDTWSVDSVFDLVKGKPGYDILDKDLTISAIDTGLSTLTFSGTLPSDLAVGDWVCLAEETCFPFLPPEGHIALIQCATTAALEALGDPAQQLSAQKAELQKKVFESLISVRIQGQPKSFGTRVL